MAYLLASELSDISPHLLSLSPLSLIAAAAQYSDNCPNLSLTHLAPGYIFLDPIGSLVSGLSVIQVQTIDS